MKPQFSARGVLLIVTVACVWAAAIFSVPDPFALPLLAFLTLLAIVGLAFCVLRRGIRLGQRVYCVGSLLGLVLWVAVVAHRQQAINQYHEGLAPFDHDWEAHRQWQVCNLYRGYMLLLPIVCAVGGLVAISAIGLVRALQRAAREQQVTVAEDAVQPQPSKRSNWICAKCNELNEPSFETFWNCQAIRVGND